MEHTPSNIDAAPEISGSADDKENKKKDKKSPKAERLVGAFAVKPEAEESRKGAEKLKGLWHGEPKPETEAAEKDASGHENGNDDLESDHEVTALSPDEKHFIERELVRAEGLEAAETGQESGSGEADPEQKVQEFRQRVFEGEDSDAVYHEMISELRDEQEPAARTAEDTGYTEAGEPEFKEFGDEGEILLVSAGRAENVAGPNEETAEETPETGASSNAQTDDEAQPPEPPRPPQPPRGGGTPPGDSGDPLRFNYRQAPQPGGEAQAAAPAAAQSEYYYQDNTIGAALLGGLVGYLIGRRRGRIKTERRLLPIQKKLRNEVRQLHSELQAKEMHIREAAKQKSSLEEALALPERRRHHSEARRVNEPARTGERPVTVNSVIESAIPKPVITEQISERIFQRTIAPEASAIHGMQHAREHIGHVVVTAEAQKEANSHEARREIKTAQLIKEAPVIPKHVEEMNRNELMAIGEKIVVDGSSLRTIYENRLIGERGLKRLVAEHLRGGDVKRALRREIVEREIDFERDPVMRDHAPAGGGTGGVNTVGGTHIPLQMLLQKAAASIPSNPEEAAYYTARAEYEAKQQAGKRRQQRVLDNSLTGIIVVLLVVIIFLILKRS